VEAALKQLASADYVSSHWAAFVPYGERRFGIAQPSVCACDI